MQRITLDPPKLADLHCHVLPGLDDGPSSLDDSLEMLRMAEADGISTVVATPHADRCTPGAIRSSLESLRAAASSAGIAVDLLAGSEIRLESDLPPRLTAGNLLTINSTPYVLLELPLSGDWPPFLAQATYELQMAGYLPVLAHAERYPRVQREPEVLSSLIDSGVVIQINGDSLLGRSGDRVRRTAETLIGARLAHLIASDAHSPRRRDLRLAEAIERAATITGGMSLEWYQSLPWTLLRGQPVTLPEPISLEPTSWLDRLRGVNRR